jgi:hypothetical protein
MKSKKIGEYEVRELTVGKMLPILAIKEDQEKFQIEIAKATIYKNGQPMGEDVLNLGLSDYLPLLQAALEVSGLGGEEAKKD